MKVGVFRRLMSFLFDVMPIILLLSLMYNFFVGEMLKPDNYDEMYAEYLELQDYYFALLDPYEEAYNNGEITLEEYQFEYDNVITYFNLATRDNIVVIANYFIISISYYVLSYVGIYFVYSGFTKGRTVGRRLMKIELGGKVTWWRLFVREVIWKTGYWMLTFVIGGLLLDVAMISFSRKKLAPRDIVSGIYVKYEGVDYPF